MCAVLLLLVGPAKAAMAPAGSKLNDIMKRCQQREAPAFPRPRFTNLDGPLETAPGCKLNIEGVYQSRNSWPFVGVGRHPGRRDRDDNPNGDNPNGTFDLTKFRAQQGGWVLGSEDAWINRFDGARRPRDNSRHPSFVAIHQGDARIPPTVQVHNDNTTSLGPLDDFIYLTPRDVVMESYPHLLPEGADYTEFTGEWMELIQRNGEWIAEPTERSVTIE